MAITFGEINIYTDTVWVKNFVKITLSCTVLQAFLCVPYLENL